VACRQGGVIPLPISPSFHAKNAMSQMIQYNISPPEPAQSLAKCSNRLTPTVLLQDMLQYLDLKLSRLMITVKFFRVINRVEWLYG